MISQHETLTHLGARLKAYRTGKGLPPEEVAKKTGISRAAIYRYEAGHPIKVDVLGKIADLLEVSLASLLGVGVEYFSTSLDFFERMRQLESTADQLCMLFGPVSYLLTSDTYDEILPDVLTESIPADVSNRNQSIKEIEKILAILKQRKKAFWDRRPNIVSLVSAAELEQFCTTGFIGCASPENVNISKRKEVARKEVNNIIELLDDQPMGIQIGVLIDSLPGSSFQIFKQSQHAEVAVSPFSLGFFANIRIGVATIYYAPEAIKLHYDLTEELWERSLKGSEAIDHLKRKIS